MSFQKKQVEDHLPTEQIRNGKLSGVRIWHQAQSVMMCDCRLRGGAEVVGHSTKSGQACEKNDSLDTNWTHMVNFFFFPVHQIKNWY